MNSFILHGTIIHSPADGGLSISENSYLVCENGLSAGIFAQIPDSCKSLPVIGDGSALVIPGMTDLHLHAPQFPNLGLGMDMELLNWLETFTFPTEASFADPAFAQSAYGSFTAELSKSATTRAAIFATLHSDATLTLMRLLENSGLITLVGKVNMDRNSPDILIEESAGTSLRETELWLDSCRFERTRPIITPRFVPSCTPELMDGLGKLAAERDLPIQSHLSENLSEIDWVKSLHPDCDGYGAVYVKYGLMTAKTIMAHCVFLTDDEVDIMSKTGSYIAHCPTSNINIRSGIANVSKYLRAGVKVGLGTDIAAGHTLDMFDVMRYAMGGSKLSWRHLDEENPYLTATEVFRLATFGGGSFFGKAGCFDEGYELDALIIDDSRLNSFRRLSGSERFERMLYLSNSGDITAKYVKGRKIF